ncbi:MAG: molybdopterin-dependent oxidoreductase, partial [Acholeplasmataceae bacterium]|nr:molybdopterin-dependent oxidoreductase [Acholeplasmataceae bacterium]
MSKMNVLGKNIPRIDGISKVTGQTKYLPDMKFPGMLFGKILRSTQAHALIKEIDCSRALKLPGVRAVITAKDVPQTKYSFVPELADKEILCSKKVRFIGDEVAAVAADTEDIAEQALKLIHVKYEPLPPIFDPEEAIKNNSILVNEEKGSNIAVEVSKSFGDVEKGFADSDFVFEDRFTTTRQAHCCMETRGCIAQYEADGKVTVWAPTQLQHRWRKQLADALGIDRGKIRIINTPIGGAFGSKVVLDTKIPITVMLSKATKRPVKMTNSREEEFTTSRTRYPFIIYLKTGVTREGRIIAKQARVIADNGAYCDEGSAVLSFAGVFFSVLYDAQHTSFHGSCIYTNKQPCTAFRGFGNPQLHYAFATHLDRIANKLGLDPMEIRMRNQNKKGHALATNAQINVCTFKECIEEAAKLSDWDMKRKIYNNLNKESKIKRGIGMAAMLHTGFTTRFFGFNATDTFIKLSEDGIVSVITPVIELGQGGSTAVAQIVAEGLGAKPEHIRVINTDTDIIPYDLGVYGSRHTFICGHAALDAALKAKEELLTSAASMLGCKVEEIDIANGNV